MTDERHDTGHTDGTESSPAPPRRRSRAVLGVAAAVVVALVVAGLALATRGGGSDAGRDATAGATGTLEPRVRTGPLAEMAPAPLGPREAPVTAWTGSELVVVGGDVGSASARDGAAYDPASDTWRPVAEAPVPVDARQVAVWTGEEVVVATSSGVLSYDPADDAWRELDRDRVPAVDDARLAVPVPTAEGVVYPAPDRPDSAVGTDRADVVLDEDGVLAVLPPDPFGASWDRSLAWDGERLWLLSTAAEDDARRSNDDDRVPARLAVLEGGVREGTWRVVDDETPPMSPEAMLWWCDDRLVVDRSDYQEGRVFDATTGAWDVLPASEAARCALAATERDGTAGGSLSYSALGARFADNGSGNDPGACPLVRTASAYVWVDDEALLAWDGSTGLGCRTGAPPGARTVVDPCPDRLVGDGRVRFGFGTVDPAPRAPALTAPDAAYVCRYLPSGPPPAVDGAYTWESDLCCEAVPLTGDQVARLTDYLGDLAPPGATVRCAADRLALTRQRRLAGPRYLVTLRTGDDLTGVVLDDFGCGHVRLTDDPFEIEPGSRPGADGVVPGVLAAPDDLVDRLAEVVRLHYPGA